MNRYLKILKNQQYVSLLEQLTVLESGRIFCRHDLQHFLDVARLMYIMALEQHLSLSKDLIYAAALLHDIGRVQQYTQQLPHNQASAEIAASVLKDCGYLPDECRCICKAILSHRNTDVFPGEEVLSALLYRADKLSRNCFCCQAREDCYWEETKKNQTVTY